MKTMRGWYMLVIVTACISVQCQELTKEQLEASRVRQEAAYKLEAESLIQALEAEASMTPDDIAVLQASRDEADWLLLKMYEAGLSKPAAKGPSPKDGGGIVMNKLVQSGTSYIQNLINSLGITDNQMYTFKTFDSILWHTDLLNPGVTYPWGYMDRILTPTNGYMAVSPQPWLSGGQAKLWSSIENKTVVYTNLSNGLKITNAANFILRFKYTFEKIQNGVAYFRCATNPTTGFFLANMSSAPTTNWTQVTTIVTGNSDFSVPIYWILIKDAAQGGPAGPFARLDAVQAIKIPGPTADDLGIDLDGNLVKVQWNTLTYIPGRFHMEYAENVAGPWATNTVIPVVSDYVATVTFTNSGGNRFYRMAHN